MRGLSGGSGDRKHTGIDAIGWPARVKMLMDRFSDCFGTPFKRRAMRSRIEMVMMMMG